MSGQVGRLSSCYEPAGGFEWILLLEVIEHMCEPADAIGRCVAWLAPGGSLLVMTPHGDWESTEYLEGFSLASSTEAICRSGAEAVSIAYLGDREERRRWLVGQATAAARPPPADDSSDKGAVAKGRRAG
jgi:2-polyprenyl-3-methyl-5-hydroxy-6-metoxy-1,4-benzoquinol methylase